MKKLLSFAMMMAVVLTLHSQTVIFGDNFDSYTAGTKLTVQNSTNWTTWSGVSGGAEDPVVSNAQAETSPNSIHVSANNDLIYKFQNQTSGYYRIEMDYFIPTGSLGGSFNVQHDPGAMWAFECYFNGAGYGQLKAGGTTSNFNMQINTWVHIQVNVNLDDDLCTLFIAGSEIRTWPFHYTEQSTTGLNQLGCLNFWTGYMGGGIATGGNYFVDNFKITAVNFGKFVITPETPIVKDLFAGTGVAVLNLSNTGNAAIDYEVIPVYEIPNPNSTSTGQQQITHVGTVTGNGIGWVNPTNTQITVASGYTPDMLSNHIGKTIRKFEFAVSNVQYITAAKLCIWDMGAMGMPSLDAPVYQQIISASSLVDGANSVNLTTPKLIDGRYIYIGLDLTIDAGAPVKVHVDDTPVAQASKFGRLMRSAQGWNLLNDTDGNGLDLNGVWEMYITVDGTPVKPWMLLDHTIAKLQPSENKDLAIIFGASDIVDDCLKKAHLVFHSTDFDKEKTIIDVTANFIAAPVISVTPTSINTEVALGDEDIKTVSVVVRNTGNLAGEYTATVAPAGGWLTLSGDAQGSVATAGTKSFNAIIDPTGLAEGVYDAAINISTTDIQNKLITIACHLKVSNAGIETYINDVKTILFPNPATDLVNVECNKVINSIQVVDFKGQVVYDATVNNDKTTINTSNLSAGYYFIRVVTNESAHSVKLIVK